jgi:hypothetical protein
MNLRFLRILTALAAAASLAACGGGHKNTTTTTTTTNNAAGASPAASPAAYGSPSAMTGHGKRSAGAMNNGAMTGAAGAGAAAPVPSSLDCGSTQVVWVNERSHVYHYSSDPYYGRTKSGKYMCEADALKAGDHASKSAKTQ